MQGSSAGQWYGRRVQSLGQSWTKSGCSQARSDERAAPGPRLISTRFVTVHSRHSRTWAGGNSRGGGILNPAVQSLLPRFLLYSSSVPSPVHLVPPWLIPGTFREPRAHSAGKRHTLREVRVSTWSSSICLPWHRPSRPGSGRLTRKTHDSPFLASGQFSLLSTACWQAGRLAAGSFTN